MIEESGYYRVGTAAAETGVPRSTIQAAIERGELSAKSLGDGLPIVKLADVIKWKDKPRQRGPKPKPA